MKIAKHVAGALALTAWILATPGWAQQSSLEIALDGDGVVVSNATAGGSVAVLGALRHSVGFASRLEVAVRSGDVAPGVRSLRFDLGEPVPEASVWLAVDLESGHVAVASPLAGEPTAFELPLGLTRDSGRAVVSAVGHSTLEFVLVRKGLGIWRATAADGGLAENSGVADGRTDLLDPQWRAVAGAVPAPGDLLPSDLLLALDPATFQLDAQLLGGLHDLP